MLQMNNLQQALQLIGEAHIVHRGELVVVKAAKKCEEIMLPMNNLPQALQLGGKVHVVHRGELVVVQAAKGVRGD
jgi:hypothetical protein